MDPTVERFSDLWINRGTEPGETTERSLDVTAGAAKTIIQVQMPESGIEVVQPHQADHTTAEPYALRVARRTIDGLRGFCELVSLALAVLCRVRRRGLLALVLRPGIPALGNGATKPDKKSKAGRRDALNKSRTKPVSNAPHEVPNRLRAAWRLIRCKSVI